MPISKQQFLGIAASLAWAIAALTTVTQLDYSRASVEVQTTHVLCMSLSASRVSDSRACQDEEARTWNNWTRDTTLKGLGLAILPIPFGWVFAEFIAWSESS